MAADFRFVWIVSDELKILLGALQLPLDQVTTRFKRDVVLGFAHENSLAWDCKGQRM
jgi:hypothetical protein